jgi:hypothetical protein
VLHAQAQLKRLEEQHERKKADIEAKKRKYVVFVHLLRFV